MRYILTAILLSVSLNVRSYEGQNELVQAIIATNARVAELEAYFLEDKKTINALEHDVTALAKALIKHKESLAKLGNIVVNLSKNDSTLANYVDLSNEDSASFYVVYTTDKK